MAASTSASSARPTDAAAAGSSSSSSQPVPTLYVNNIPLSVKKPELRRQLYALFSPYGRVIDVVACKGTGKHGQAFVVFREQSAATSAMRQLVGEEFYGKSLQITYARSVSKATQALQQDPEAAYASAAKKMASSAAAAGDGNGGKKVVTTSRAQDEFEALEKERVEREDGQGGEKRTAAEEEEQGGREGKRRRVDADEEEMEMEMDDDEDEDEQQGPAGNGASPVLLVSSIPAEAGQDALKALFQQHPGFRSLDMLPLEATPTRSASVAFASTQQAEAARRALDGFELMKGSGQVIRVVVVPAEAL